MAQGFINKNVGQVTIKKNQFDLSHTNNTTSSWGTIQPVNVQFVPLGGTTVNFSVGSIIRLAPLVAPTFGRIKHVLSHHFVPAVDVYPFYNEVLAHKPVSLNNQTVTITKVPYIDNKYLFALLLSQARFSTYARTSGGTNQYYYEHVTTSARLADYLQGFDKLGEGQMSSWLAEKLIETGQESIRPTSTTPLPSHADFTIKSNGGVICFYFLSQASKNLYKHIIACGYKPNLSSYNVNILPLLAIAKAYFDEYAIHMYDNYKDSPMWKLINYYQNNQPTGCLCPNSQSDYQELNYFYEIIKYLSETYYSVPSDYLTCQLPVDNGAYKLPGVDGHEFDNLNYTLAGGSSINVGRMFNTDNQNPSFKTNVYTFDQVSDELLCNMYYSINKSSAVGYSIKSALLARGFDEATLDRYSYRIGTEVQDIEVEQVTSLAATDQALLGEYSGRASSNNPGHNYTFETPSAGFIISLSTIAVDSSPIGALNPQLLGIDEFTLYNPQFDGVGFEFVPNAVAGKVDTFLGEPGTIELNDALAFGASPRYTGYKTRQAVANGDMLRPVFRDTYLPYQLEQVITPSNTAATQGQDIEHWTIGSDQLYSFLPGAGKDWRYPTKRSFTSNYDRVFAVGGLVMPGYQNERIDNFMQHHWIDFKMYANMLPVEDTWETQENEQNERVVSVNQ